MSQTQQRRGVAYVSLIAAVIVLPTAVALAWFHVTKDPNLRPLGITEQALRAYRGDGDSREIVALVDWGPTRPGGPSKAQLALSLSRAFAAKGADVRVVFREGRDATRITYVVGGSTLGPFPIARASDGVAAAVEAFTMH
ncbi:hypothetical protein GCM10011358_01460 [Sinisalibacter lacisalsi]|uniref:Uncharacterized protein n=1 Tax=Sinisalibacter lacisalsi TaxID=1526570 RepID=A0ABQ1QBX3_9RHOB|nr:hypothetical protein GCM10011358_01460 [Sinisalibacter lacisalsi]